MNDLEICKRIAEIEGFTVSVDVKPSYGGAYANIHPNNCYGIYNPLTDDALCFQLMVKYKVELSPMVGSCWCATVANVYTFDEQIDYKLCPTWLDENPNIAICLVIIEANKRVVL